MLSVTAGKPVAAICTAYWGCAGDAKKKEKPTSPACVTTVLFGEMPQYDTRFYFWLRGQLKLPGGRRNRLKKATSPGFCCRLSTVWRDARVRPLIYFLAAEGGWPHRMTAVRRGRWSASATGVTSWRITSNRIPAMQAEGRPRVGAGIPPPELLRAP